MRYLATIFLSSLALGSTANAETPWEAYLRTPSSAAAAAVTVATYTKADPTNRQFERDVPVLAYEVAAGDGESIKLAVRLLRQYRLAAAISEYLDSVIGRAIRVNPQGYLAAVIGERGCPGSFPSGDLFVDRPEAREREMRLRIAALGEVIDRTLIKKRDECVSGLERDRKNLVPDRS